MKTQAGLVHFQLNVEYLMFNIVGKTEIGLVSEDEGPVIGLLWLKWFIAMTFFPRYAAPLRKVATWPLNHISQVIRPSLVVLVWVHTVAAFLSPFSVWLPPCLYLATKHRRKQTTPSSSGPISWLLNWSDRLKGSWFRYSLRQHTHTHTCIFTVLSQIKLGSVM